MLVFVTVYLWFTENQLKIYAVWQSCVAVPMFRQPVRKLPKIGEKICRISNLL